MKVIFLADDDKAVVVNPEKFQLRQAEVNVLTLGVSVPDATGTETWVGLVSFPANATPVVVETEVVPPAPEPVAEVTPI